MPRNSGTNIYTIPPDTEGIPDQTIESATYNIYIHDIETDLNNPRPIIAGGTGANDADEALFNLGGEKATQLVTNYDTHVWVPGSFRSAGSATAGPVDGHAFAGIVYINEPYLDPPTNANVVVSARDMNDTVVPSRVYVREKKANVWGTWTVIDATTLPFPPGGGITADTILEAIQELDAEKASLTFVAATYAPIDSPLFTGDARAPTPTVTDNDTSIATTAYVNTYVAAIPLAPNAAPFETSAYSGMQHNGAMEISQENGATQVSITAPSKHVIDGWSVQTLGSQVLLGGRVDSGTVTMPTGFVAAIQLNVTTANAAPAAASYCFLTHRIETCQLAPLLWGTSSAKPMTIGFWAYAVRSGTYSGAVLNGLINRSYTFSFSITAGATWEYKTFVIPGDTTGTWIDFNSNDDVGMYIGISMMTGTTYTTAPNAWTTGTFFGATGTVNGVAALTDKLQLTGFVALPGTVTLTSDRAPMFKRTLNQELAVCMRYYQKHQVIVDTAALYHSWSLPVVMRVPPTITGGGAGFTIQAATLGDSAVNVSQTTRGLQTLVFEARL